MEFQHNTNEQANVATEFSKNREKLWASSSPLNPNYSSFWVGIIPDNQIAGIIKNQRIKITMAGVIVLIICILLTLRLVRNYGYQLRDLPGQNINNAHFENEVLALIDAGESATLKFKSTMRSDLRTGKEGKEREIVWMKTEVALMNSDGGILLIGVDVDGKQ